MIGILGNITTRIRRLFDSSYGLSEKGIKEQAALQSAIREPEPPVKRGPGRPRKKPPTA